jgi:hypothetical protein
MAAVGIRDRCPRPAVPLFASWLFEAKSALDILGVERESERVKKSKEKMVRQVGEKKREEEPRGTYE